VCDSEGQLFSSARLLTTATANPGGRLVQTWPISLDQLPQMMDYDIRLKQTVDVK